MPKFIFRDLPDKFPALSETPEFFRESKKKVNLMDILNSFALVGGVRFERTKNTLDGKEKFKVLSKKPVVHVFPRGETLPRKSFGEKATIDYELRQNDSFFRQFGMSGHRRRFRRRKFEKFSAIRKKPSNITKKL